MTESNGQQEKQHLTTAQLSALIDGQMPVEEREFSDAHLATCEQCRQELAGLRQTAMLLRALPRPELPRSFTLPLSTQQTQPTTPLTPVASTTPIYPITSGVSTSTSTSRPRTTRRQAAWSAYGRTMLRSAGTLAAMVGFVLLLSSLIPFINAGRGGSAASSGSNSGPVPRTTQATQATPGSTLPVQPHAQGTAGQPTLRPPQQPAQGTTSGPPLSLLDFSTILGRASFGLCFLLIGVIAMIAGRREPHRGP